MTKIALAQAPLISLRRRRLLQAGLAGLLPAVVSCGSGEGDDSALAVGGLPVTCNLTLPVAMAANLFSDTRSDGSGFRYVKFSGWPEIKEALAAGRIQAAFMLAPLVMDLADRGIPLKIVSLGHRSGAVIMVRKDSGYDSFRALKGKRIAIPSRFAVDYLFLRRMLKEEGMGSSDVEVIEMPPPDMPAALYVGAIDAYCTGEPFGAAAERAGFAKPLRLTRDEWPRYICCVLTVQQELIDRWPSVVQRLVNLVLGAGLWLDQSQRHRDLAAAIAASREYFNQDVNIIRYVMENPSDRVTYGDLRMVREEMEDLMQLSLEARTLRRAVPYETYVEERFARAADPASIRIAA